MVNELTKRHLTEDDLKVLKHLRSIDNLFKKGDLTIWGLFADNGTMKVLKTVYSEDYTVETFYDITCDGGDPDNSGRLGIRSDDELENLYLYEQEG